MKSWILPPSTGKGLVVTDELINHARHSADSATVTAQLRPHSFHHLTANANTFRARFCLRRHGNISTRVLVRLPKLALSHIYLALHFYQEALHMLVLSWSLYSSRLNYLFFPQFSRSIGHVSGLMAYRQESLAGLLALSTLWYPITHSTSAIVCSDFLYSHFLTNLWFSLNHHTIYTSQNALHVICLCILCHVSLWSLSPFWYYDVLSC